MYLNYQSELNLHKNIQKNIFSFASFFIDFILPRKRCRDKRNENITFKNYVASKGMYTNDRESFEINFTHQSQCEFLPYVESSPSETVFLKRFLSNFMFV